MNHRPRGEQSERHTLQPGRRPSTTKALNLPTLAAHLHKCKSVAGQRKRKRKERHFFGWLRCQAENAILLCVLPDQVKEQVLGWHVRADSVVLAAGAIVVVVRHLHFGHGSFGELFGERERLAHLAHIENIVA